jgi:hypothetical protein
MKKISYLWNILIFILLRSKRPCQAMLIPRAQLC